MTLLAHAPRSANAAFPNFTMPQSQKARVTQDVRAALAAVSASAARAVQAAPPQNAYTPTLRERAELLAKSRHGEAFKGRAYYELLAFDRAKCLVYVRRQNAQNEDGGKPTANPIYAVSLSTNQCDCEDCRIGRIFQMRRACLEAGTNPDALPVPLRCKHNYIIGFILMDADERGDVIQNVLDRLPTDLPRALWPLCPSKTSRLEVYNDAQ